jgi:hypothetical protein
MPKLPNIAEIDLRCWQMDRSTALQFGFFGNAGNCGNFPGPVNVRKLPQSWLV